MAIPTVPTVTALYSNSYLELTNVPPRTKVPKRLILRPNPEEGNLCLDLWGRWSEYKPEEIEQIIAAMQKWLNQLGKWKCKFCGETNLTTPPNTTNSYRLTKWFRCRHCKKKTPIDKL